MADVNQQAQDARNRIDAISVTPIFTIVVGTIFNLLLLLLWFWLLSYLKALNLFSILILLVSGVSLYYFGIYGLNTIDVGFRGVPLILGKRVRPWSWLVNEGTTWLLPPPLMGIEIIDLREQTSAIEEFEFLVRRKDDPEGQSANMLVSAGVQWMIFDPWRILSTGEAVVAEGFHLAIISSVRRVATTANPVEFLLMREKLGEEIIDGIGNQTARWGALTLNVNVPYITFANEDTRNAFERAATEAREREGEILERDFVIESINKISKENGVTPEIAAYIFLTEREKMKQERIIIDGPDSLIGAAATFRRNQGNTQN